MRGVSSTTTSSQPQPLRAMVSQELVNQYGTYNIQRTAETENFFPAIAQGLPKDARLQNRPEE